MKDRQFNIPSPMIMARLSVLLCFGFAVGGIFLGKLEHSLAVEINGFIAAVDIVNSLLFLAAVHQSLRSADNIHNYGYGKYESLAILASALLLTLTFIFAIYEAISTFGQSVSVHNYEILISFSALSYFIMRGMANKQNQAAQHYFLPMLQYDADIWRVDSYIELGVIANLSLGVICFFLDWDVFAKSLDSIVAISLLFFALKVPLLHAKDALWQLLDRTLPEDVQIDLLTIIGENLHRICSFEAPHTRQSGKDFFIELDMIMPFDATLEDAFNVETDISNQINAKYPNAIVRLYVKPCDHICEKRSSERLCPILIYQKNIIARSQSISSY